MAASPLRHPYFSVYGQRQTCDFNQQELPSNETPAHVATSYLIFIPWYQTNSYTMPQYLKMIMKYGVWQKVCYPCYSISETLPPIFSPNLTTTHCSTNKRNNYSRIVSARSILYILFYWISNQISKQQMKTAPNTTIVLVLSVYREKKFMHLQTSVQKVFFLLRKKKFQK